MTVIQSFKDVGLTHASIVMVPVRSREFASGIVTVALAPLKFSALPNRPVVHAVPEVVPALPLPDESVTAVPMFSSNASAATSPVDGAGPVETTRLTALPAATGVPPTGF